MEDEGSGGRSRGPDGLAIAPSSPPPRAKTVRMSEARDFIIPYAADQGRFDVGQRTRPATAPLSSLPISRVSRPAAIDFLSLFVCLFCRCGGQQRVRRRLPRERRRTRRTTSGGAPRGTGSCRSSPSPPQPRRQLRDRLRVRDAAPRAVVEPSQGARNRKSLERLSTITTKNLQGIR